MVHKKCIHNKRQANCKECGGGSVCEHQKIRSRCKECDGGSICEHNKRQSTCKECKGSSICEHNRRRSICKECYGGSICEHKKVRSYCKECDGGSICEHKKIRSICKECDGGSICEHKKVRSYCKECKGGSICEHNKQKRYCRECNGNQICQHNKLIQYCRTCGGYALCKNDWCLTIGNPKYKKFCLFCFIKEFPTEKVVRNYKIKEKHVVDNVLERFPNFTWFHDKRIKDGCSLRRPDLFLDYGTHVLMIEIDEQKHESYDCSCINRRTMELSLDINHKSCVIIRFNPDGYIDGKGNKIMSPWKVHKNTGILSIMKTHSNEWNDRIQNLLNCIHYWILNPSDKMIEIIEMYY